MTSGSPWRSNRGTKMRRRRYECWNVMNSIIPLFLLPRSPPPPWGAFNWGAGEWGPAPPLKAVLMPLYTIRAPKRNISQKCTMQPL